MPLDQDLAVAVIDQDGVHALQAPCRRRAGCWVDAKTGRLLRVIRSILMATWATPKGCPDHLPCCPLVGTVAVFAFRQSPHSGRGSAGNVRSRSWERSAGAAFGDHKSRVQCWCRVGCQALQQVVFLPGRIPVSGSMSEYVAALCEMVGGVPAPYEAIKFEARDDKEAIKKAEEWAAAQIDIVDRETILQLNIDGRGVHSRQLKER